MAYNQLSRWLTKTVLFLLLLDTTNALAQVEKKGWAKLVPDHLKLQYAGGIGFFAFGAGYESRNQKFETDIYYGFLPQQIGGEDLHSATLKFTWFPLKPIEKKEWLIKPLAVGALINYSFGSQYYSFDPRNYPFNYYRIPTSINTALILGGQAGRKIGNREKKRILAAYFELLSFDRELVSFIVNTNALSITDILTLGLGVKYSF